MKTLPDWIVKLSVEAQTDILQMVEFGLFVYDESVNGFRLTEKGKCIKMQGGSKNYEKRFRDSI